MLYFACINSQNPKVNKLISTMLTLLKYDVAGIIEDQIKQAIERGKPNKRTKKGLNKVLTHIAA